MGEVARSRVKREVCLFCEWSVFVCRGKCVCLRFEFNPREERRVRKEKRVRKKVNSRSVVENVLMGYRGAYVGNEGNKKYNKYKKSTLWANNDLNVLYGSPLFDDELADTASECPFVVNGHTYRKGYYLADNIYPAWSTFVKSFSVEMGLENIFSLKEFKKLQGKILNELSKYSKDEGFAVNVRDLFVSPTPHIQRTWVERCELHLRKSKELRDRKTHIDLRHDLVEHLWNNH
ncbi:ALP1-like protein isoform X1 [Tanacetum coccineum]